MRSQTIANSANRRVMIFIDGSNLYHVLKKNTDKRNLDYKKFSERLCGDRELIRTYYYNIRHESPDNPRLAESQDRFLNALYETDYLEVKLGIWKQRGQTMVEKGVDVMIASDLISHAYEDHYDTAILVSGDADFYPALQVVKDTGKQVEVAAFDSNLSSESARISDVVIKFNRNYFNGLWMSADERNSTLRTARMRETVTDEAASPNGEDKSASRSRNGSRRPFADRYFERRNILLNGRSASRNGSNGAAHRRPVKQSRQPAGRRSLGISEVNAATPPDLRSGVGVAEADETSRNDAGSKSGTETWLSRVFKSQQ